jgi:hypothetical protein
MITKEKRYPGSTRSFLCLYGSGSCEERISDQFAQGGEAGFGVVDFWLAGVGVLPEVEEEAVILGRAPLVPLRLGYLPKRVETF